MYGPPIQEVESLSKLNTSNAALYDVFSGKAEPSQSVYLWVDVRDIALAHVLAIVSISLWAITVTKFISWYKQEKTASSNERFLITEGRYSAQQIVDFIWANYPDRAQAKGVSKGTPGTFYPESGTYTPDNSKSKNLLKLEYHSFETMLGDLFKSFEELERQGK